MKYGLVLLGSIILTSLTPIAMGQTGVEVSPEDLFKAAEAAKSAGKFAEAETSYRAVIKLCNTEALKDTVGVHKAWMGVGNCCLRQKKFRDAYAAFDRLETDLREKLPEVAADAAYFRYRAATALYAATRDPEDGKLKKEARTKFAMEYAEHPRAMDLMYYEGAELITDADLKLVDEENDEAQKAYESALYLMGRVKRRSVLYEKAQMRRGEILFKMEKYDEALEVFRSVLAAESTTPRADRKANIEMARVLSTYYGALCHGKKGAWGEVLQTLDGFEATFSGPDVAVFEAPLILVRVRACLNLGGMVEAQAGAKLLKAKHPGSEAAAVAFELLGKAWQDAAIASRYAGTEETMSGRLAKAKVSYQVAIDLLKTRLEKLHEKATAARARLQKSIDRLEENLGDLR